MGLDPVRRQIGLRAAATLALAVGVLGCGAGGPVKLLTGVGEACYAGGEQGATAPLVVDLQHGTSFAGRPVMWPIGFTARRAGAEVEVLDAEGNVRATTGRIYHISLAPAPYIAQSMNAYPAAVNCGYGWDFVDCTAEPTNVYCWPPLEYTGMQPVDAVARG